MTAEGARTVKVQEHNREYRLTRVSQLYAEGKPQYKIAELMGVTQAQISNDLTLVRQRWLERQVGSIDAKTAEELAKIDNLERVAWEAWDRSCSDLEFTSTRVEKGPSPVPLPPLPKGSKVKDKGRQVGEPAPVVTLKVVDVKQRTGRVGDERFLARIAWCIETRAKLLGLVKEDKAGQPVNVNVFPAGFWERVCGAEKDTADELEDTIRAATQPQQALPEHKE